MLVHDAPPKPSNPSASRSLQRNGIRWGRVAAAAWAVIFPEAWLGREMERFRELVDVGPGCCLADEDLS